MALLSVIVAGLGLGCLGVLAWLTLQWGILPHIEDWRPAIEQRASAALGVPVRIGSIRVRSSAWVPALELHDVVLSDPAGPEALRLPLVSAAISPQALLSLEPRLAQLYIDGARLLVRRDAQGRFHVGGLDMAASATVDEDGGGLDWFFRQSEFVIRHGSVRWVDEARQAPPLELADVDLVVRNGLRSHDLRVDASPPADWGERLSLRGRFTQPLFARPGDWRRWSGTAYAELPRGRVAELRRHVDLPFALEAGEGALRLWLDLQAAQWRSATIDLQLADVRLRLPDAPEPLAITHAQGRLAAQRDASGVSLQASGFGFETAAGGVWPGGDLRLAWLQQQATPGRGAAAASAVPGAFAPWRSDAPVTGGSFSADRLDLGLMREIAGGLPLPAAARQWLADRRPQGVVSGLDAGWDGPPDHPRHYHARARLQGLALAAGVPPAPEALGRPGLRRADVELSADETGGRASLAMDGGALELPGVFDEPVIPFDRLAARIDWQIGAAPAADRPPPLTVNVHDLRFANADAEGTLQARWHSGDTGRQPLAFGHGGRFPGQIELKGELQRGQATRIHRYLPRPLVHTRDYLRRAVRAGDLKAVQFSVQGDLADFPFRKGSAGEFRIAGHVDNGTLAYVPGALAADGTVGEPPWPAFSQVQGDLAIDADALEIRNARGRVYDVDLQNVRGGLRGLHEQPVLSLQGHAQGPLGDFLRYVAQSPVGGWLGDALRPATANGPADLELALALPMGDLPRSTVTGSLVLPGNDLRLRPGVPALAGARGRVDFTQKGFAVIGASAHLLGGDASFDGGSQADGGIRFNGQGVATADGLRRGVDEPQLAHLAGHLSGQAPYKLQLGIVHGQVEYTVTSPLAGVGFDLPPPLAKPADASWPLRVQASLLFDPAGHAAPRETLHVDLGSVAAAELQRELLPGGARLLRSAYAIGTPLPAPQPEGIAVLQTASLDADAWWAFWRKLANANPGPPANANASAPASPATDGGTGAMPRHFSFRAADLLLFGHHLGNVDVQVAPVPGVQAALWRAAVQSDQTHGIVEYRPADPGHGAHLYARLDRLALNAGDALPEPAADGSAAPVLAVPSLDIVVENFELNARKLGKLEVSATQAEGARDWRLARLALTVPEASFVGSGAWSGAPQRRMALDFKLALADSGAFLGRLGLGQVLKGGKGQLGGAVAWTGSPLALDLPSLEGKLQLALESGQFLKADAGAARLLGVLSLQSLPRRLTLDFRDLFQEGFAFDNVTGDVGIGNGVARTNNLRMRGVNAAVLMEGSADLIAETQDLRVVVVPEVNAGTASLAYAAINPVIGLGTFLAQMFLRRPLMQAGTREFHVAGPWADPKVEAVAHTVKPGDEAASEPAPAASAP